MNKMEPPPPLFNTWRPSTSSKSLWLSPSRLWLPFFVLIGLVWILMMRIGPPSSNGPVLTDISRSQCSRSSSNDMAFLPSSVTVLPSGSFYSDYSELFPLIIDLPVGLVPATVVLLTQSITDLSAQDFDDILHRFDQTDDVWDSHFLSFVVFAHRGAFKPIKPQLPEGLANRLQSLGTKRVALVDQSKLELDALMAGPYFATATGLLPVRKLFPDTHAAFVASLVQSSSSQSITYLNATTADAYPNQAIAVPSRLYFAPDPEKPLNGLRVAIKDNIDIAGAKTFASSLAYGQFHGIKSHNAPAIQRLLDLGAVIVGKTGMSQFADAEDPTGDFVDFHAPWNPRGDGLRSPGGSSYGSGAAAGAYDWIDFTIGTDTGGSVRQPAASQSVYGLRPSKGAMSVEGTVVIHSDLDAIGVLSRNLSVLHTVSYHLYPDNIKRTLDKPLTLIYPSHLFPVEDAKAQEVYDKAVQVLEKVLGVTRRNVNFHHEWKRSHPDSEAFTEYFKEVFYDYVVWGQWKERSTFRNEYQAKFGRPPYVNPLSKFRWELGSNMTEQHFSNLQAKRQEFQAFIEDIFGENTIMITPFKFGEPDRRDEYRPEPKLRNKDEFGWGLRPAFQTPMAGQPEIVFPVSQLPVFSSVSQREERYGVIASLIGSQGMDMRIVDIAEKLLKELDVPQTVLTGRTPFHVD